MCLNRSRPELFYIENGWREIISVVVLWFVDVEQTHCTNCIYIIISLPGDSPEHHFSIVVSI